MTNRPNMRAPLDPDFEPAIMAHQTYAQAAETNGEPLVIALERENGLISRYEMGILPSHANTPRMVERTVKFLLWARGAKTIYLGGDTAIGEHIKSLYTPQGERAFDTELMERVYEQSFEVQVVNPDEVPAENESELTAGGHLDGCRIGFDLGASDYKVAAVVNGEAVYSNEIPWNPTVVTDPGYHYTHIHNGLKEAAAHLPRVDAIGGSSAGVYVNNRPMVASLYRGISPAYFESSIKPLFERIQKEWDVPLVIINDGDVTALAGGLSLGENALLGIAMESSEAAGYLNTSGRITGWLNELAFCPVDFNPNAALEEWSGDRGVGAMYFSQQAVNKLAPAAGLSFPEDMLLPERLKEVQALMEKGDERAARIFETIGVYLGYTLPYYAEFYDIRNLLILGRVTSGEGGNVMLNKARDVLKSEFSSSTTDCTLHVPDEKSRRVGQAVAAASLPIIS